MAITGFQTQPIPQGGPETGADRVFRIAREEAIVAKAEADIDAGLGIEDDDLEKWLVALDREENAPLPAPRSGPNFR